MQKVEKQIWRFIDSGAADGSFNMATDEVMATLAPLSQPVLRVYRWHPFTISIGYNQNFDDLDTTKCEQKGIGLVRRPTGGRAILHAHEVTYCVIIPRGHSLFGENPPELYNQISSAIVKGLKYMLPEVILERKEVSQSSPRYNQQVACFATSAKYEIHYESKKVVGSAQRRFRNGLLQHGSIILGDEHLQILEYLSRRNGNLQRSRNLLQANTVSMERILKRRIEYQEIVKCIKAGFENHFGILFEERSLSQNELRVIEELKLKYLLEEEL